MNRRERKKEQTKDNIIDCAVNLFNEKGFYETSMEEIAEKSDVSKGTLYNYFQDKESILVGYFQCIIADNYEELKETFKEYKDIKSTLNSLLDFINQIFSSHLDLAAIYFRYRMQTLFDSNPLDSPKRSGLENSVLEIVKAAQDNQELRKDIPLTVLARNFQFLTMSYFITNIYEKETFDIELVKSQLIELFLNGAKL